MVFSLLQLLLLLIVGAIVTTSGKDIITNRIKGAGTEPLNVAIGTGTTAEAAGQTLLVTEVARSAGTSSRITTTTTNDTYQVVSASFTTVGAITESGLFDVITANTVNMLCRAVFAAINVASGDSLVITWKVQLT